MDGLFADGAACDLHWPIGVVAPSADLDFVETASTVGKQGGVPGEYSLFIERILIVLGGVEHHFDHAVDVAGGGWEPGVFKAKVSGDRRTHLLGVQPFAFDLARFGDVLDQDLKDGLLPYFEAQRGHGG